MGYIQTDEISLEPWRSGMTVHGPIRKTQHAKDSQDEEKQASSKCYREMGPIW